MTRCIHCTRCVRFGTEIAGVDKSYLNPRNNWDNPAGYDEQATKLAKLFVQNITKFAPSADIIDAGPKA